MALSYEEALSTLQSMFGETWTKEGLDSVLRYFEGHMENTIEAILNHGTNDPQALISKLNPSNAVTDFDEDLARQLAREEQQQQQQQRQQQSSTTSSRAPITNTITTTAKRGLGTSVELPAEFLRIPGYNLPSTVAADEQLARMLQDEILQRELANSREFGYLARNTNAINRTNYPAPGGGTVAAASAYSEGPNIMDKLAEMGDQAKSRLTLWAAQLNAQSKKIFADTQNAAAAHSATAATQERTSLLNSGASAEEEVTFSSTYNNNHNNNNRTSSRDYEMKSMDGKGNKKDK
jgi:hypothetical protein